MELADETHAATAVLCTTELCASRGSAWTRKNRSTLRLCWVRLLWPADAAQDEAERQRENLTDQIERAAKHARHDEGPAEGTELRRDAEGEPLRLALAAKRLPAREAPAERAAAPAFEAAERDDKVPGTVGMCVCFPALGLVC